MVARWLFDQKGAGQIAGSCPEAILEVLTSSLSLYRNPEASVANVTSGLLEILTRTLNQPVAAPDLVAYLAAVAAHPNRTSHSPICTRSELAT